jgi:hypothetical protein
LFDAEHSILVLEGLDGVNAADALQNVGAFDARVAAMLGERLACLHGARDVALCSALRPLVPGALPWVLQPPAARPLQSARSAFLSHFETDHAVARELSALRAQWARDTLIHGDARLENFLICRPTVGRADLETRIVDWELVDVGDAAWDCAGVMQHFWREWAATTPSSPESWETLRQAIERFWDAYVAGLDGGPRHARPPFRYAARLTGVRLVQTTYEHVVRDGGWTPGAERCARAARLLLIDTDAALAGFGRARHVA